MEPVTNSCDNLGKLTLEDRALLFIKQMKQALSSDEDGKNKYDKFFFGMEDYKFRRISFEDLMSTVEDTLEGHEILFSGFKKFLLNSQETDQASLVSWKRKNGNGNHGGYELNDEACTKYLKKVKDRFEKKPKVYEKFLTVLEDYEKGDNNVVEVYKKILKLFIGHFDLMEEFGYFFSDLDKKTQEKIEEIKTIVIENQLSKVEKAIKRGIDNLELAGRVLECSDSISKGEFIRDIEVYFSEDDLESLRELHSQRSEELEEEYLDGRMSEELEEVFKKHPRELFGDIINDRLKMKVKVRSVVCKKLCRNYKTGCNTN